jgi:hypothetical protein
MTVWRVLEPEGPNGWHEDRDAAIDEAAALLALPCYSERDVWVQLRFEQEVMIALRATVEARQRARQAQQRTDRSRVLPFRRA